MQTTFRRGSNPWGFRIGYDYRSHTCSPAHSNPPSTREYPEVITKYLSNEIAKARITGPFPIGSITNIQISHIGELSRRNPILVSGDQTWIFLTPWERVNNAIDPKMSSLTYTKVDDLANEAAQMGKGTLMAKMDVEEAIPIHPDDRHLLGIYWDGQVYMDAALPFDLRSAPLIFTALADGLQWVLQQLGTSFIAYYLDNFITLGPLGTSHCTDNQCNIIIRNLHRVGSSTGNSQMRGPQVHGGAGAFWIQFQWPHAIQQEQIAIKELASIAIACALWGRQWKGTLVRANCNNKAVVIVINSVYSQDSFLMYVLRCIFFFSATFDLISLQLTSQAVTIL